MKNLLTLLAAVFMTVSITSVFAGVITDRNNNPMFEQASFIAEAMYGRAMRDGRVCHAVNGASAELLEEGQYWFFGGSYPAVKVRITSGEHAGCVGWIEKKYYRN